MLQDDNLMQGFGRRDLLILLVLGFILMAAGIGLRDPWPADEPRFALVAQQMVDSGQWLFPFRGGELYPDKPPLFMWTIAIVLKLTGSLRFAFLAPSLLSGLGCLALVHDLARRLWDRATAWRAGLLLLLIVQFTLQARTAQIDALVTFFIALGLYGLLRFLLAEGGWGWYALGWFAAGLGVITKGVGILALFVLLPALWTHREAIRKAPWVSWLKALSGPVCFLAAIALWIAPMLWAVEHSGNPLYQAYRDNILLRQTVTRYGSAWHHVAPWYDYLVNVVPAFWLPVSLLLPWLAHRWWNRTKEGDARIILLLSYLVLVVVFFSASPGKRGVYLTPATPALALLTAPFIPDLLRQRWPRRLWFGLAGLLASLPILLSIVLAIPSQAAKLTAMGFQHLLPATMVWAILSIAALVTLRRTPAGLMTALLAAFWLVLGFGINPAINDGRTPQAIMKQVEATLPPGGELLLVDYREQFLLFATRPLNHLPYLMRSANQARLAAHWQQETPARWVLGPKDLLKRQFNLKQGIDLGERHSEQWVLLPPGSSRPSGPKTSDPIYHYVPSPKS